jgi:hypothetical protein
MISFNKGGENTYKCMYATKNIGYIHQEVDGFYYFYPAYKPGGRWEAAHLKEIYLKLEALNYAWANRLKEEGVA